MGVVPLPLGSQYQLQMPHITTAVLNWLKSTEEVILWLTVSHFFLSGCEALPLGPVTRFWIFFSPAISVLSWGCPFWQDDRSAVCSAVSHWLKSCRTHNRILLSHMRLLQPGGPGPCIHIPQEQNGAVKSPGIGFPIWRLLQLAGLQQRYSNPPPLGLRPPYLMWTVEVGVMLRLMVSQSVCRCMEPALRLVTRYYFLSKSCCLVSVGRPLWRKVESTICHSQSVVIYMYAH
jgi:hypothetical protein